MVSARKLRNRGLRTGAACLPGRSQARGLLFLPIWRGTGVPADPIGDNAPGYEAWDENPRGRALGASREGVASTMVKPG